jgi:hypothetical protein
MGMDKKLIWKKTRKAFRGSYASWYALSPVNDFVFIAKDQGGQWSNHIIYKKHLHLINDIDWLLVDDLSYDGMALIDSACHTLKCSKAEFQRYVDNLTNHKKHSFEFYILKDYVLNAKR